MLCQKEICFAVVADEIRKLAESTTVSTKEIVNHINEIDLQSRETAEAMNGIITTITSQSASIESTNTLLEHITNSVNNISNKIVSIDIVKSLW